MKRLTIYALTVTLLISSPLLITAQTNHSTFFNDQQSTLRSVNAPSHLGDRINTLSVQLPSTYFWISNSGASYGSLRDFGRSNEISESQVDDFVEGLQELNVAGTGLQIAPLMVAAKIKNNNEELFTFSLGTRFHANVSAFYSKNLFKLIWQGNKQFAGEEVELGPFSANAVAYNEYFLGAAVPLPLPMDDIKIRPGFRLSYITSFGTIYTPSSDASMFTAQNGRYIDMDLDYEVSTSIPEEFEFKAGEGYKLDVGTKVEIGDQIMASIAVNNIGFTEYSINTHTYYNNNSVRYEGVETELIGRQEQEEEDIQLVLDSLREFFDAKEHERNFRASHGPQLILHGAYRLNQQERTKGDRVRKYHLHNIYLTYKQGFRNVYDVTTRPEFQAAYMYNLNTILNVGGNIGYGGFNRFQFGGFLSVRGGPFVFSFASNNLLGAIPAVGTGLDFSLSMALNF